MASRREQKEQLRQERLVRERAEQERARRRQRLYGYAAGGILIIAAMLAIGIVVTTGGGGANVASASPFGQHYNGLEERRTAADVSTMMNTMDSTSPLPPPAQGLRQRKADQGPREHRNRSGQAVDGHG